MKLFRSGVFTKVCCYVVTLEILLVKFKPPAIRRSEKSHSPWPGPRPGLEPRATGLSDPHFLSASRGVECSPALI